MASLSSWKKIKINNDRIYKLKLYFPLVCIWHAHLIISLIVFKIEPREREMQHRRHANTKFSHRYSHFNAVFEWISTLHFVCYLINTTKHYFIVIIIIFIQSHIARAHSHIYIYTMYTTKISVANFRTGTWKHSNWQ